MVMPAAVMVPAVMMTGVVTAVMMGRIAAIGSN